MAKCKTAGLFRPGEDDCQLPGCGEPRSSHQINQRKHDRTEWQAQPPARREPAPYGREDAYYGVWPDR